MNQAWADRELREARRTAAMLGATLETNDTEDDSAAQAAEHRRLAAHCRKLRAA